MRLFNTSIWFALHFLALFFSDDLAAFHRHCRHKQMNYDKWQRKPIVKITFFRAQQKQQQQISEKKMHFRFFVLDIIISILMKTNQYNILNYVPRMCVRRLNAYPMMIMCAENIQNYETIRFVFVFDFIPSVSKLERKINRRTTFF